eukprot:Rmarinus@m.21952
MLRALRQRKQGKHTQESDSPLNSPERRKKVHDDFVCSALRGDLDKLRQFQNLCDVDLNYKLSKSGHTALHAASQKGNAEIVEFLCEQGADANAPLSEGATPLFVAAQFGHASAVETLIKYSAEVNVTMASGHTPLHVAAENNAPECVRILLNNTANVFMRTNKGSTALHLAAECGHAEVVQILLDTVKEDLCRSLVNDYNHDGLAPLHIAACHAAAAAPSASSSPEAPGKPQVPMISTLLHFGADPNLPTEDAQKNHMAPLHVAVYYNRKECVRELIAQGADVLAEAHDKITPLHVAVERGHRELVDVLAECVGGKKAKHLHSNANSASNEGDDHPSQNVKHGNTHSGHELLRRMFAAQTAAEGLTPLHVAVKKKTTANVRIILKLLKLGADCNARTLSGLTALHLAAMKDNGRAIDEMVRLKADLNILTPTQHTPLHFASRYNAPEAVRSLLKGGADALALTDRGSTVLHLAAGHAAATEQLVADHAVRSIINAYNDRGYTAVHVAAWNCAVESIRVLRQYGADVNLPAKESGYTPLHIAVIFGQQASIRELVHCGADTLALVHNMTPLHVAVQRGLPESARALLEYLSGKKGPTSKRVKRVLNAKSTTRRKVTPLQLAQRLLKSKTAAGASETIIARFQQLVDLLTFYHDAILRAKKEKLEAEPGAADMSKADQPSGPPAAPPTATSAATSAATSHASGEDSSPGPASRQMSPMSSPPSLTRHARHSFASPLDGGPLGDTADSVDGSRQNSPALQPLGEHFGSHPNSPTASPVLKPLSLSPQRSPKQALVINGGGELHTMDPSSGVQTGRKGRKRRQANLGSDVQAQKQSMGAWTPQAPRATEASTRQGDEGVPEGHDHTHEAGRTPAPPPEARSESHQPAQHRSRAPNVPGRHVSPATVAPVVNHGNFAPSSAGIEDGSIPTPKIDGPADVDDDFEVL